MLKRHLTQFIEDFYATSRKALLLTGARQTGKTYAAREFGKKFNIRTVGRITYIPIYMVMFLQPLRLSNPMYDVDLTGLTD